jgi:invasion protein IalB
LAQQLTQPGNKQLILGISMRKEPQGSVTLVLHTPLGVSLTQGVTLSVNDVVVAKLPFTSCQSTQCQATASLTSDVADAIAGAEKISVSFQRQSGDPVNVAASVRGLREAFAALQ